MTRADRVSRLARSIERNESCEVLSAASITSIENELTNYAVERLAVVREQIASRTLDSHAKQEAIAILTTAINEEVGR